MMNISRIIESLVGSGRGMLITCLGLLVVYLVVLFTFIHFDNSVPFFGDGIEYQSMAVNFAKGHGIQKAGGIEDFSVYCFTKTDMNFHKGFFVNTDRDSFMKNIRSDFYREPVYPLFLGLTYKIFGIYPKIAKNIQLFLLVIMAAILPILGFGFWKRQGFVSGLVSGPVFLYFNHFLAGSIQTEAVVTFLIFCLLCSFAFFANKKSLFSSIILGVFMGLSLQAKGSLVLIPLLYMAFLLIQYFRKRDTFFIKHFLLIFFTVFIIILPWLIFSNYTFRKEYEARKAIEIHFLNSGNNIDPFERIQKLKELGSQTAKFFFISYQSQIILLNGHNEYVPQLLPDGQYNFPEGGWLPEWRFKKGSFYNNDGMKGGSPFLRLINFYRNFPGKILKLAAHKIILSFSHFKFFWLIILLFLIETFLSIIKFGKRWWSMVFLILGIIAIIFIDPHKKDSLQIAFMISWIALIISLVFRIFIRGKDIHFQVPVMIKIIFIDFFLVTIFIFGFQRMIQVIDFMFILVAVQYFVIFVKENIINHISSI